MYGSGYATIDSDTALRYCFGIVGSSSIVTVRRPFCGSPVTRIMSPSPSVSMSCPGVTSARSFAGSACSGLSHIFHSESSSLPSRHSANVCSPSARATRIWFSAVTASRNHTSWRSFASSSSYAKCGFSDESSRSICAPASDASCHTSCVERFVAPIESSVAAASAAAFAEALCFAVPPFATGPGSGRVQSYPNAPIEQMILLLGTTFIAVCRFCSNQSCPATGPGAVPSWCSP